MTWASADQAGRPDRSGPEPARDVFFNGLFMDEAILRDNGVEPRSPRKAALPGFQLVVGRRAMLRPRPGARAAGMVFALTDREIEALYSGPGPESYRPVPVNAVLEDGIVAPVTTFNHDEASGAGDPDTGYAAKLRALLERLGFPAEYAASVG